MQVPIQRKVIKDLLSSIWNTKCKLVLITSGGIISGYPLKKDNVISLQPNMVQVAEIIDGAYSSNADEYIVLKNVRIQTDHVQHDSEILVVFLDLVIGATISDSI